MATVYKRGRIWWARWYQANGDRISKSTGSEGKREARVIANSLEADDRKRDRLSLPNQTRIAEIIEEAANQARRGKLTLAGAVALMDELKEIAVPSYRVVTPRQCAKEWLAVQRAGIGTVDNYRSGLARILDALGAQSEKPLQSLEPGHLEKAVAKIRKTAPDVKASTVNIGISAFRRMLVWAVKQKWIPTSPAESLKNLPETDSGERAPFTANEVRAMMATGGGEWAGLILLGAHTGLRLGDLRGLCHGDIQGSRIVMKPAKTLGTGRVVEIPLSPACLEWIGDRHGPLFPTLASWGRGTTSNYFKRIMERAGVPDKIRVAGGAMASRSFHSLRHTFASWLAAADVHADVRQKLTGHSSAGIHARYTHHDAALDRAIRALPEL